MIKEAISTFNVKHFTKEHDTIAHRDKTHKKLRENCVRDRTLKGQLNRKDCDNEKVCTFLKLLKISTEDRREQEEKIMTEKDWTKVVTQSLNKVRHRCFLQEHVRCANVH